jgi:hypothetical protein
MGWSAWEYTPGGLSEEERVSGSEVLANLSEFLKGQ